MMSVRPRLLALPLAMLCLAPGCASGPRSARPPRPEPCPEGAIAAMRARRIWPGDDAAMYIDRFREDDRPVTLEAGPVESKLFTPLGDLPNGALVFGYLWTLGDEVVIRYYEATDAQGVRFPFCAIAHDGEDGLKKFPGSPPGKAIIRDDAAVLLVVDTFREKEILPEAR
jgi:hypothetical protein